MEKNGKAILTQRQGGYTQSRKRPLSILNEMLCEMKKLEKQHSRAHFGLLRKHIVFQDAPKCAETIPPANLFSFFISASVI